MDGPPRPESIVTGKMMELLRFSRVASRGGRITTIFLKVETGRLIVKFTQFLGLLHTILIRGSSLRFALTHWISKKTLTGIDFFRFCVSFMAMKPSDLTAPERLAEVAELLALGLIRMRGRMSSQKSADVGEICLDIVGQQSGPELNSWSRD
jgi:hypothetical protein